MKANTQGQDLVNHLKATANISKAMAQYLGLSEKNINRAYIGGLLHDIGKAIKDFQTYICGNSILFIDDEFCDPIINKPLHHEVGWAFLTYKIIDKYILNAIYWHHAKPINIKKKREYNTSDAILENISEEDHNSLNLLLQELLKNIEENIIQTIDRDNTYNVPDLFEKDEGQGNKNNNSEFMLIRACVISADRYISSLIDNREVDRIANNNEEAIIEIEKMLYNDINGDINTPNNYDKERFDLQCNIVDTVGDNNTTIIKAPAGLGKTMIGVLWAMKKKEKTIWVCPRNAVTDSVYESIIKEISVLGLKCSVELHRTGERLKTNTEYSIPEFSSDIIVTNIDTIMSPMVKNGTAGRLFTIYGSNIVLDEFHELVSDAPLFATFIIYMRARHRLSTNCKTLLLSATPSTINVLWDNDIKTLLLPNESEHYPPQHTGKYKINFIDNLPKHAINGSLLVSNSISEAQNNYKNCGYTHIIHHGYTEKDRKEKDNKFKNAFSKGGNGVDNGESLSAALVVQAAMDISFRELFDSVCSPESSCQRIGRVDRWGNLQNMIPTINFVKSLFKKNESCAIDTVYDKTLSKLWIEFLENKLLNIDYIDLVQLYKIYNEFYQKYRNENNKYLKDKYQKSMEYLSEFQPKKILDYDNIKKNKNSCKSLRSPDGSNYFTVQIEGEVNKWLPPEDVMSEGSELWKRYEKADLQAKLMNQSCMRTYLKGLVDCGYLAWTRYSKGKINMKRTQREWFNMARSLETPLPDFSRKYDKNLGLIKINDNLY